MKKLVVGIITIYRNTLAFQMLRCCRFYPSCSGYALEAIERYGVVRGCFMSMKRLMRCHPFNAGGYDPVESPVPPSANSGPVPESCSARPLPPSANDPERSRENGWCHFLPVMTGRLLERRVK